MAGMKLAYVISRYPAVSHTFVLREVAALRELGVEIDTFSIRRVGPENVLSPADQAEFERTFALLPARLSTLVFSHAAALFSRPGRYVRTFIDAIRAGRGMRAKLWQAFYFMEAIILWRQCTRRGIRHIHAHFANVSADVGLLAAHFGHTPQQPWAFSFTMHGPTEFYDVAAHGLARKVQTACFVACISDFCRSQLMAFTAMDQWSKLAIVHCGIDTGAFHPQRAPTVRSGDAAGGVLRILTVARLAAVKGHLVLLQALVMLRQRNVAFHWTVVGDGPESSALANEVQVRGLADHVTFAGAVGHDKTPDFYAAADVFCLPSFAEGVPVVLMEAMACGLPVVATQIMGIPELVETGVSGVLAPAGRPEAIADALAALAGDSAGRAAMGQRGRAKVQECFDVRRCAAPLLRLFENSPAMAGQAMQTGMATAAQTGPQTMAAAAAPSPIGLSSAAAPQANAGGVL